MILTLVTLLPALVLIFLVYKLDKLEKEPMKVIRRLVICGVGSTFVTLALGFIPDAIKLLISEESILYNIFYAFIGVALVEEFSKYIMMRIATYKNKEFNCEFDGIVYAVTVSMGFALFENILYVMDGGLLTALLRAITAIPGHACDGILMGIFYGYAKGSQLKGDSKKEKIYHILAVLVPMIAHGIYDYILFIGVSGLFLGILRLVVFGIYAIILFIVSAILLISASRSDSYIDKKAMMMHESEFYDIDETDESLYNNKDEDEEDDDFQEDW